MRFNDFVYDPDYDTYKEPVEGKTYISPQMADSFSDKSIRLVNMGNIIANFSQTVYVQLDVF